MLLLFSWRLLTLLLPSFAEFYRLAIAYIPPTLSMQSNFIGICPPLKFLINYPNDQIALSKFNESEFL